MAVKERTVGADDFIDSGVGCMHSCCIGLLYFGRPLPYETKRICIAACHTYCADLGVLSSEGSLSKLVCAVVTLSGQLFVLRRRMAIAR